MRIDVIMTSGLGPTTGITLQTTPPTAGERGW